MRITSTTEANMRSRSRSTFAAAALAAVVASGMAYAASPSRTQTTTPAGFENPVLRVEVTGKGQPMIPIPGLTCSGDVWRETVAHYSKRYQCHAVTLGGFAGRPRYEGPFLDTARDSLLAYMRARHL